MFVLLIVECAQRMDVPAERRRTVCGVPAFESQDSCVLYVQSLNELFISIDTSALSPQQMDVL